MRGPSGQKCLGFGSAFRFAVGLTWLHVGGSVGVWIGLGSARDCLRNCVGLVWVGVAGSV